MNFLLVGFLFIIFIGIGYFMYNKYIKVDPTLFVPNDEYKQKITLKKECDVILFTADWCPHCKKTEPEWIKYTDAFNSDKYTVYFKKVLGDNEPVLIEKYNIENYPTIILVKDGLSYEYDSNFSKESMDLFIETIMNN
jgi:thiol-disulfide isomerase/thioredoxin